MSQDVHDASTSATRDTNVLSDTILEVGLVDRSNAQTDAVADSMTDAAVAAEDATSDGGTMVWQRGAGQDLPEARRHHAMAYDSIHQQVVLFGGSSLAGAMNDTWSYDGNAWRLLPASGAPSARVEHAMAYDSDRG